MAPDDDEECKGQKKNLEYVTKRSSGCLLSGQLFVRLAYCGYRWP